MTDQPSTQEGWETRMMREDAGIEPPSTQEANPRVAAIYYQPPSEGVQECVSVEMVGGQKRFARFWAHVGDGIEWGWSLHPSAQKVFDAEAEPDPTQEAEKALEKIQTTLNFLNGRSIAVGSMNGTIEVSQALAALRSLRTQHAEMREALEAHHANVWANCAVCDSKIGVQAHD